MAFVWQGLWLNKLLRLLPAMQQSVSWCVYNMHQHSDWYRRPSAWELILQLEEGKMEDNARMLLLVRRTSRNRRVSHCPLQRVYWDQPCDQTLWNFKRAVGWHF